VAAISGPQKRRGVEDEKPLPPLLAEFRTALREEIDAAKKTASAAAVELVSGRRVASHGDAWQYQFLVGSPLNLPDDSPADLIVPGQQGPIEAIIVSVSGLTVVISVRVDLGEFVGRARIQTDLTFLLRALIGRLEELGDIPNPAGSRLLGLVEPSGESVVFEHDVLNEEQREAVSSALGRDLTFVWGPPGTGKTMTLGTLATELHRRGRSALLVSHTNAAVDQALLHVAHAIGEDELARGLVLRLGESKDDRILNTPDLLVKTHVERRSAQLVAEREQLDVEQGEQLGRKAALDRLIDIAEWLPDAPGELYQARAQVAQFGRLDRQTMAAAERHAAAEADLAPWRALAPAARRAVEAAERLELLKRQLPGLREHAEMVGAELERVGMQAAEAEAVAEEAAKHVPQVRAAQERLVELEAELPRREPLLAATDQELDELAASLSEAKTILTRAEEASVLTRRLRGLPHPDQQRQTLESLLSRQTRLDVARTQAAQQLAALNVEFRQAEQTIADYGHLPDPETAAEEARALEADEKRLRDEAIASSSELNRAERELTTLGAPLNRFRSDHGGQDPHEVLIRVSDLTAMLEPIAVELVELRQQTQSVRARLEESLVARCRQLHAWSIADRLPDGYAALADMLERSIDVARGEVLARSVETLRREREQVRTRLREIATRLGEITQALEQIEHLVIAEASVVATTLTRAYFRESVQARAFDTVILDEASMAPIPALWVVAARAEKSVVLVGDFMQLPPIKHSNHELAREWLGRDIFDKAAVRDLFDDDTRRPAHCVQLREQRRMHPQISAISNRFVYSGKLRDGDARRDAELLDGWFNHVEPFDNPVLLVDTSKLNAWVSSVSLGGRSSRLNFLSASVCADIALMLLRPDRPPFQPGRTPRILLCAPYRPHAKLMSVIAKDQMPVGEVVAGTAHTFQGAEAPVLIFDLVNDEPHWRVGMFGARMEEDTKRLLNVALTRPQRRLIVVGDFRWIEQKAKKDGILRRILAHLKDHHPIVDASDLVPAGLAPRAVAVQQSAAAERDTPVAPQLVVAQDRFYEQLHDDLAAARQRVVVYSPFMTQERVGRLELHLRAAIDRNIEVWVITKTLEERSRDRGVYLNIERALRSWGIRVVHKKGMHEKLVMIDGEILWQGSLNPLSYSSTQEIMERRASREILADYARVLRLDDLLAAYRADQTRCPYCGGEVVASEGANEPFYWRCVEDRCFTRSIGDPMPVDGRVVCHSCGGQLEFRWPNRDPFWRCADNHRHRQPVARTHLRLPKMRELIPKAELRKLDRRFDVANEGGSRRNVGEPWPQSPLGIGSELI
jgi:hypothetical protein